MRAIWMFAALLGCSGGALPDPDDWSPPISAAGTAAVVAGAGGLPIGMAGSTAQAGSPELPDGGRAPIGSGGGPLGGTGGDVALAGGNAGMVPAAGGGFGGSSGAVAATGGASVGGMGGTAAPTGGSPCCSQGGSAGLPVASGGVAPVDQCASMPGKLLVSYPATNAAIDGGTDPAPPSMTAHSLRVWFTSPAGYCDETFGGSLPPRLTLNNDQIGTFALPGADLCFNGNTTGEVHIDPAGGFARVMGMGASWVVQGICVRVRRNHWTEKFHVNGDVDETWELWGTD